MDSRRLRFRVAILLTLIFAVITLYAVRLYKLQMVGTEDVTRLTGETFTYDTTFTAARGSILDASGEVLVSNRASYDLSLVYYVLFNSEDPNGSLQTLAETCARLNVPIRDHLPVSTVRPYSYDFESVSSAYEEYFNEWLDKRRLKEDMSAEQLVRTLRSRYHLPEDLDDDLARTLVGIRYELDLRNYFTNLDNYVVAYDVPTEDLAELLELSTPGLSVLTNTTRVYHTTACAHILGSVGLMSAEQYETYKEQGYPMNAVVGQDGLELAFESYLHGTDGRLRTTVTKTGEIVDQYFVKQPQPGMNVQLTIDLELQETAEAALADVIEDLHQNGIGSNKEGQDAQGGAVVVQEVKTGRILACGSYPTYNLANLSKDIGALVQDETAPLYNRALSAAYPPGSVFKMVTTIAMIDIAGMSRWYQIEDKGIYDFYEETPLRCFYYKNTGLTHGLINVSEALSYSCNYYFYEIGRLVGWQPMDQVAKAMGLGEHTGVELLENVGTRANPTNKAEAYQDDFEGQWFGADTLTAAIGQSVHRYTPMQLCCYTSTLANGGIRYKATFLDRVRTADDTQTVLVNEPTILSEMDISQEARDAVLEGMMAAAEWGTATNYLKDYPIKVACKTGTAEHGGGGSDNCSFVIYAPADDPQIAISVYVEKGAQGGNLAHVAIPIMNLYFAREEGPVKPTPENGIG